LSKNKIVSKGFNKLKTHPKLHKEYGYYSIHAECDAVLRASKGDTLVVVRILRDDSLACSKPCVKCLTFLRDHGIKKVIYIDWNSDVKEVYL